MKKVPTVYIVRGGPGSGKNEFLLNNFPEAFICSAKNFRPKYATDKEAFKKAHELCKELFLQAIAKKVPFIAVKNGNLKKHIFAWYVEQAREAGYAVVVLRMKIDNVDINDVISRYENKMSPEKITYLIKKIQPYPGEIFV